MINVTEQQEREYLEEIKEKLQLALRRVDDSVKSYSTELKQNKEYIYEHQSGMDDADMVAAGQSINRMAFTGESAVLRRRKLLKLGKSPYFARIDFVLDGETEATAGLHRNLFFRRTTVPIWSTIGAHPSPPCFTISNWAKRGTIHLREK